MFLEIGRFFRHWAPNCSTFSRARERPIPGVLNPPIPLRSDSEPKGIRSVVDKLPPSKRRKITLDTEMADLAANDCMTAHRSGRKFSLEHPKNSIARKLESWQELEGLEGVEKTEYHACMFPGCSRRKSQVLIHNIPDLIPHIGRVCESSKRCSRTGKSHAPWKPRVEKGRVTSFPTGEEREYSSGLCAAYAEGIKESLTDDQSCVFLEVFSGPNAPLSSAVAEAIGTDPPPKVEVLDPLGVKVEKSELTEKSTSLPSRNHSEPTDKIRDDAVGTQPGRVEKNPYREAAVQAGKQPSYGKRLHLIADGLQSPEEHLRRAKELEHPFDSLSVLKKDHRRIIELLGSSPQEVISDRFQALDRLVSMQKESAGQQTKENRRASWTARKLGLSPKTALMRKLQEIVKIEDQDVPELCLKGITITGRAKESNFFEEFEVPPSMSQEEFHSQKITRSKEMIERVAYMAKKGSPQLATAIWEKTMKEVKKGTMGPPQTWEQIEEKFGSDFQVTPSFGLEQGVDEAGNPKFRRIDDHSASGVNPSAHRLQKAPMAMIDYVGVMLRALASHCSDINMATEDMKGAYRQVPLHPSDVRYAITAVYNPQQDRVSLFEMYGQPFGAGHAVPNFCRVSEWICRFMQRYFHLNVEHFFDDFFIIEPAHTIKSAVFILNESFRLLGFTLDPEKAQAPSSLCAILGVLFSSQALASERLIRVVAKPTRVANLNSTIQKVLDEDELTSAQAGSIVGKFGFLCSSLFGKVGRFCTAAVRQRQYSVHRTKSLTPSLCVSLQLMQRFLSSCPERELKLSHTQPVHVYTDASDVPGRAPQRVVGAVLFDPLDNSLLYTSWAVTDALVATWVPKKSLMGQLEVLAAPFAFSTWTYRLAGRSIILWIDNDAAAASLVKGYSPKSDSSILVGEFWLLAASIRAHVYIDRVESKSNIADGPSRLDYTLVRQLGGHWTVPKTGTFGTPRSSPPSWSWHTKLRGERS